MFYRTRVLAAAFVAVGGVFSGAAFGQSIEGVVRGPDGKALRMLKSGSREKTIRAWPRPRPTLAVIIPTPDCHRACIKVSVVLDGAVNSSVNVKTTTTNSRIDFDLKPAAAKKVKHYVWVRREDRNSYGKRLGRSG